MRCAIQPHPNPPMRGAKLERACSVSLRCSTLPQNVPLFRTFPESGSPFIRRGGLLGKPRKSGTKWNKVEQAQPQPQRDGATQFHKLPNEGLDKQG